MPKICPIEKLTGGVFERERERIECIKENNRIIKKEFNRIINIEFNIVKKIECNRVKKIECNRMKKI